MCTWQDVFPLLLWGKVVPGTSMYIPHCRAGAEFWSQPCAFKSLSGGSIELLAQSRDVLHIMTLTLHCSKGCCKGKLLICSVKPWENAKHNRRFEETADCLFSLLLLKGFVCAPFHSNQKSMHDSPPTLYRHL